MKQDLHADDGQSNIILPEVSKVILSRVARWTKFLAISSFVLLSASVIIVVGVGIMATQTGTYTQNPQAIGYVPAEYQWPYAVVYLLIISVLFLPAYYLHKFSNLIFTALYEEDSAALTKALRFLKNHYKYIALIMIAGFILYNLATIILTTSTTAGVFGG